MLSLHPVILFLHSALLTSNPERDPPLLSLCPLLPSLDVRPLPRGPLWSPSSPLSQVLGVLPCSISSPLPAPLVPAAAPLFGNHRLPISLIVSSSFRVPRLLPSPSHPDLSWRQQSSVLVILTGATPPGQSFLIPCAQMERPRLRHGAGDLHQPVAPGLQGGGRDAEGPSPERLPPSHAV